MSKTSSHTKSVQNPSQTCSEPPLQYSMTMDTYPERVSVKAS